MKKTALVIPLLVFLTAVSCINWDFNAETTLTITNGGRFEMRVSVWNLRYNYSMDTKRLPEGETAVWTDSRFLTPGVKTIVQATYVDDKLSDGGSWSTSFDVSYSDDISLTIPGCPGWYYYKPDFSTITYGNGIFVASNQGHVLWSPDGTSGSWSISRRGASPDDIAFGNDRFVGVDRSKQAWSTTDVAEGDWSLSLTDIRDTECITYGNGRFVAAGSKLACWSTDCSPGSWAQSTAGTAWFLGIAFGNDRFVAVGDYGSYQGKAAWSPDGTEGSWTESSACGQHLLAIAFGDNRFVAVGDEGQIVWSPDGSPGSWTESSTGGPQLVGITYGNDRFMVIGSGIMMSSPDGSTGSWTKIELYE